MTVGLYPVSKQVSRDGCLVFYGRRFWSPDSAKFAGKWVSAHLPGREDQVVMFWQGDDKYTARVMADVGFCDPTAANPAAAQLIVRRMRLRAALNDAQGSISALLQLLDQEAEACRDARASAGEGGIGLAQSDVEGGVSGIPVDDIEGKDVREKELLEGVNLILQLLNTVSVGLRHGLFSLSYAVKPNPPAEDAHRLSGGAK
ncbi:MAG: hypothetical protein U0975_09770 [Erythrobacter sp.]|nr:hypothetical protein [Erythrobacter sp.]MDZ4272948.1 hypothetical protein [Erythrobacter sp.]